MPAASGQQAIDVGALPGVDMFTTTITASNCTATSAVEAWILPKDTTDHSVDEHIIDAPKVVAHSPAAGSFSVTFKNNFDSNNSNSAHASMIFGTWNIGWVHD